MKEIKAIIQPFALDKVLDALHQIPELPGCTVSEVKGYGRSTKNGTDERSLESTQKSKLEIVISDRLFEKVLKTIQENAHTGNKGDGKVFVYEVKDVISIRTNKRGKEAI